MSVAKYGRGGLPEDYPQPRPKSVDDSVQYFVSGSFQSKAAARLLAEKVQGFITYFSRIMDLSGLDGVTIADDFRQAAQDLDRGYTPSSDIHPTNDGVASAIATTPTVIRDGEIKSHIVFSHQFVSGIAYEPTTKAFRTAFLTILHECAHVEATGKFESQFPNILLRPVKNRNLLDAKRWDCIFGCYHEYIACWQTASLSKDDTLLQEFLDVFFRLLSETQSNAEVMIEEYGSHQDHGRILTEAFGTYGKLMKSACYVLGTMDGLSYSLDDVPELRDAIEGHWFEFVFKRLWLACVKIFDSYGQWQDQSMFEEIGDLLQSLVWDNGIVVTRQDGGAIYVQLNI